MSRMQIEKNKLSLTLETIDRFFRDISQMMTWVDRIMIRDQFTPLGDSSVFWDVSSVFDRGSHWLPNYAARAYTKGRKTDKVVGYCIHFGPYTEPGSVAYLKKSNLSLPFVSIARLADMIPGPFEVDRNQIWDRLWDSGWCAETEDRVEGNLRYYRTTKDISGFQASIAGGLINLSVDTELEETARNITETLFQLHAGHDEQIFAAPYLLPQIK